jgi:prolyl-tRNA editing enzyme YbaK/EbsC (Cys-tRNA(Pro) deacylase)
MTDTAAVDEGDQQHRNVGRVVEAGRAAGVDVVPQRFPEGTKTAADAAAAIGCDVGQIVKSLIFAVDGEVVLAYVSGSNQLDEAKLAAAAGGERCSRVDADTVREATGFPIGGVPPFGHRTELRVFVDPDLLDHDEVWAAAGTWHDVFPLSPAQLVEASGAVVADLRR